VTSPAPPSIIDFATLELLPYGVIVVNAEGVVLFYNRREEEIAGKQRAEVLGRNFFTQVAPCTLVQAFHGRFLEVMAQGLDSAEFHFVFPFVRGPREVQISLHPFIKDGEALCVIFVADLTEREQVRQRILQNQRFSELGEVAAKVAHNFNNLLSVIQVGAELANKDASPRAAKHLERVLGAVADGAALVSRVREIARSGHGVSTESVDLNGSVETAAEFARQYAHQMEATDGRQVELVVGVSEAIRVQGDAVEIREMILNLLRNAIDATPGKGQVRVTLSRRGGIASLDIIDTGTGMPLEVQAQLFTPMFTTKGERGTGLGLASAYASIRRHGGSISVKSTLGEGSHFHIELPLLPDRS
jgi:photoactive yellow protein